MMLKMTKNHYRLEKPVRKSGIPQESTSSFSVVINIFF